MQVSHGRQVYLDHGIYERLIEAKCVANNIEVASVAGIECDLVAEQNLRNLC